MLGTISLVGPNTVVDVWNELPQYVVDGRNCEFF